MNNSHTMLEMENSEQSIEEMLLRYCRSGDYKQVVYIFDKFSENPGFDINCRDRDSNTALILAAKQGHGHIVQELLSHMPDITVANKHGRTVVDVATNPILKLIFGSVSTCLPYSDRMFCNACWLCNIEVVERCLAKERCIARRNLTNSDGVHCLLLPVCNMPLLESRATNIKCLYKPAQVVHALLTHFLVIPLSCQNLLHIVCRSISTSSLEVARILLQRLFDIRSIDEYGYTALHCAARSGNVAVLTLMLSRSKYAISEIVNVASICGYTPLHLAAMEGREPCVKVLLDFGASKDVKNDSGHTPVEISKSVRIKNLFQAPERPLRRTVLPENAFVLSRSNTTLPRTPSYKSVQCGKKSAEPFQSQNDLYKSFRGSKEVLNESSGSLSQQKELTSSSVDITLPQESSVKFPILSNRPSSSPEKSKLKLGRSLSLKCLDEEVVVELTDSLHSTPDIEVDFKDRKKISNGKMCRTNKVINKTAVKQRPVPKQKKELPKPTKSKLTPSLNKAVNQIKRPNRKSVETVAKEPLPIENLELLSDIEATYESDFNTDNSSAHGDSKRVDLVEIEPEEDKLNETLRSSNSLEMFTHINWRKGEQLGKGSYGTVWKGMLDDGQYIAVKEIVISEEDGMSEFSSNGPEEIKREIEILQTLVHKNIVKYLGACDSHFCIHIFMEFVSGGSIAFILSKFGGFSENIVRRYSRQMMEALTFLDNNEVIHRDIKGANVMVTPKGIIKLIDFGCAKRLQNLSSISRSVQQQSRMQGSVYWMAPEVINGNSHSHKSDVWSLGCTVIEMITTRPPWTELNPFAAMFAIGTGNKEPPNLEGFRAGDGGLLSRSVSDFINTCLIRDRRFRPRSADLLMCAFFK